MAKPRKTIEVEKVKTRINYMLANSLDSKVESRVALAVALEQILMDAEAYKGFQFTDGKAGYTDPTRRYYY